LFNVLYLLKVDFQNSQYVASKLPRRYEICYDSFTDSVHILDSVEKLQTFAEKIKGDVSRLNNALTKIKKTNWMSTLSYSVNLNFKFNQ